MTTHLHDLERLNTQNLLIGACGGDDEAWKEIYRRYKALLTVMVRIRIPKPVRRRIDTEDVLQSAFVSIYEQIRTFQYTGEGSFRRWLTRVVVNKLRDNLKHHRRAKRSIHSETPPPLDDQGEEYPTPSSSAELDPATLAEKAEGQARILEGMALLTEDEQEVICMRTFEHMTWPEIASIEVIPESQARRRYEEAVVRLTKILN